MPMNHTNNQFPKRVFRKIGIIIDHRNIENKVFGVPIFGFLQMYMFIFPAAELAATFASERDANCSKNKISF